jgi:hypothetical protein
MVERTVIHGYPSSQALEQFSKCFSGSYDETGLREYADRILGTSAAATNQVMQGSLLYKRSQRAFALQRKSWKQRWFIVEHRVLHCFHDAEHKILRRSMHLQDCLIKDKAESSHEHYFEVHNCVTGAVFKLRARSAEEATRWIETLKAYVTLSLSPHSPC